MLENVASMFDDMENMLKMICVADLSDSKVDWFMVE